MRAVLLSILLLCCNVAVAKDVPITPLWSGSWAVENNVHRCSVRIKSAAPAPLQTTVMISLDLSCAFGATAVTANHTFPNASGEIIPLKHVGSDFGAPAAAPADWGTLTAFAVCDWRGPALYASIERHSPAHAEWAVFRPLSLDFVSASKLCM